MHLSASLGSVPQEVLEHIALFAATHRLVGPPSGLPPLLLTCRTVYQALSFDTNPYFYARIFSHKFDTSSVFRRLGSHVNTPRVLADELKKRWMHLKRIRARTHSRVQYTESHQPSPTLINLLWLSYLMMLENDGKNEQQLVDYAEMDTWLMEYWFDDQGASLATHMILRHTWLIEDEKNAIAMWLFWFLLRPNPIMRNVARFPHMKTIMKLTALAANHYPISHPSWTEFAPGSETTLSPTVITHFAEVYQLNPPTLAPAAILVFLTLALRILVPTQANYAQSFSLELPASLPLTMRRSEDWDTMWHRCVNVSQPDHHRALLETYILGSLEGVWEGVFTYTEFSAYSLLLSGGAPPVLDHCLVAHHWQTWKIREYYLAEHQELTREKSHPLRPGDPLRAHLSAGIRILQELPDSVEIQEPDGDVVRYRRLFHTKTDGHDVMDIILLGEGHSAWGQFNLYGRVRPLDGFISLLKEYTEGDRGSWLYRGYLVGNVDGHISGRWRDTLSPRNLGGYEGCFVMSRRG